MPARQTVWLVSGCASSLGYRLCLAILARGDLVVSLSASHQALHGLRAAGAYGIQMDSDMRFSQISSKIRDAIYFYGQIDIVVNNPEYAAQSGGSSSQTPIDTYYANTFSYTAIQVTKAVSQECSIRQIVVISSDTQPGYNAQAAYSGSDEMGDNIEGTAQLFAAEYRPRRVRVLLARTHSLYSATGSPIPSNNSQAIAERIIERVREGGFSELGLQVM